MKRTAEPLPLSTRTDAADSEQRPSLSWLLLHCLGFGACWGWMHLSFFSSALWGSSSQDLVSTAWLATAATNGLAVILLGYWAARHGSLSEKRPLIVGACLLVLAGTLTVAGLSEREPAGVALAGSMLSSVGIGALMLAWSETYAAVPTAFAKLYALPGSMLCGMFYFFALTVAPRSVAVAFTALLPFASAALLYASQRQAECGRDEADRRPATAPSLSRIFKIIPARFTLGIASLGIAVGFIRSGATSISSFTNEHSLFIFSGAAFVLALALVLPTVLRIDPDAVYRLVTPLIATGLFILPLVDSSQVQIAAMSIMAGYLLLQMSVWGTLISISAETAVPSTTVFGFGNAGLNLGITAGVLIGLAFGASDTFSLVGVSLLILYLVVLVSNFVAPAPSVTLLLDAHPGAKGPLTPQKAAEMNLSRVFDELLAKRCALIAEEHGLSAREVEVLELLARGRNISSIAEILGIAYSTAKTHTDRIYQKTNVHSRQELISLIESTEA